MMIYKFTLHIGCAECKNYVCHFSKYVLRGSVCVCVCCMCKNKKIWIYFILHEKQKKIMIKRSVTMNVSIFYKEAKIKINFCLLIILQQWKTLSSLITSELFLTISFPFGTHLLLCAKSFQIFLWNNSGVVLFFPYSPLTLPQ